MKLQLSHKMEPLSNVSGKPDMGMDINSNNHPIGNLQPFFSSDGLEEIHSTGNLFRVPKCKIFLVILFLIFSVTGFSQTEFSLGVSGGYEQSFNYLKGLPYSKSDNFPDFSFGVNGSLNLGKNFRVRAELNYSNMSFTREWNFDSQLADRFEKSVLYINNLDITPRVDYKLVTLGKLDLFVSTGLKLEFNLGDFERSTIASGDILTSNLLKSDYTKTQAGAVGGFIFKYNLNPGFGITLAPDYTCFFHEFHVKDDGLVMQRAGVSLGVEWNF